MGRQTCRRLATFTIKKTNAVTSSVANTAARQCRLEEFVSFGFRTQGPLKDMPNDHLIHLETLAQVRKVARTAPFQGTFLREEAEEEPLCLASCLTQRLA